MKSIINDPLVHDALVILITGVISAITGLFVRKKEKSKLRKRGELKDGKF